MSLLHTHMSIRKRKPCRRCRGFFFKKHSTRKLMNLNNLCSILDPARQWVEGQTACPSFTRHQDKTGRLMHLSVFFSMIKSNSETKTNDVSGQVIQIRSGQITTMLQRRYSTSYDVFLLHSHYISYVTARRLQLLRHAVKGHHKFCHSLPDTQQILHLWSHKDLPAVAAQEQHQNVQSK